MKTFVGPSACRASQQQMGDWSWGNRQARAQNAPTPYLLQEHRRSKPVAGRRHIKNRYQAARHRKAPASLVGIAKSGRSVSSWCCTTVCSAPVTVWTSAAIA